MRLFIFILLVFTIKSTPSGFAQNKTASDLSGTNALLHAMVSKYQINAVDAVVIAPRNMPQAVMWMYRAACVDMIVRSVATLESSSTSLTAGSCGAACLTSCESDIMMIDRRY